MMFSRNQSRTTSWLKSYAAALISQSQLSPGRPVLCSVYGIPQMLPLLFGAWVQRTKYSGFDTIRSCTMPA
jgi:hypothetical protein